jgi:AcrR family transcriptional regulator
MEYGKTGKTRERILSAAAGLFAKQGYRGVSTREIARLAKVNEITIYRYFPRKHDLFIAALEWEFQGLRVRPELVAQLIGAYDLRSTLHGMFELINDALAQQPNLARLLQFSALEFGVEIEPLYRKYLGNVLDLSIRCLQAWVDAGELQCKDPRLLILSFASAVIMIPTLYPAIWGNRVPATCDHGLASFYAYADLWRTVRGASSEKS